MKKFWLKSGAIALILMITFVLAGCGTGPGGRRPNFTPGVFSATTPGFPGWPAYPFSGGGSITVNTTFSANRIESVVITEITESEPFRSSTMYRIPQAIVDHQSLNVDVVSGATITSIAIINAVAETVSQAGVDPGMLMNRPLITRNQPRTINTGILVVGSGIAGMAAAIEAAYLGVDVLVIDKLGFLGGVTASSGGMIHGANNTIMRNRTGAVFQGDTAERFANELIYLSLGLPAPGGSADMLRQIANLSTDTIDWFIRMGVNFPTGVDPAGMADNPNRAWVGTPVSRVLTPAGFGAAMMQSMIDYSQRLGVQIMGDTKAVSLRMNGANVTGVNALDITGAAITINARKVVLATGGFHNNNELMDRYHPLVREAGGHVNRWHLPGADGYGLIMARDNANAAIVTTPTPTATQIGVLPWGIWVTPEGNRFFDESWQYIMAVTAELGSLGFAHQWTIMDNANRPADLVAGGSVFTAPTLETLVEAMGVPAAQRAAFLSNLNASIAAYNAALQGGGAVPHASELGINTVFMPGGATRPRHVPIGAGPFWAHRSGLFTDIWATNSGLKINLDGQVLNTADAVIPNLYAAGEVVGWILPTQYGGSGMALTIWSNQARIAGRAAGQAAR